MPPKKAKAGKGKSKSSKPTVVAESSSEASELSSEENVQAKKAKKEQEEDQQDQQSSSSSSPSSSDAEPDQPSQQSQDPPTQQQQLKKKTSKTHKEMISVSFRNDREREDLAVEFFKEREYQYNRKVDQYKDTKKKDADIAILADLLQVTTEEVKFWWREMRDRYRFLCKIVGESGSGNPTIKLTERESWILKSFRFLHPHLQRTWVAPCSFKLQSGGAGEAGDDSEPQDADSDGPSPPPTPPLPAATPDRSHQK